MEDTAQRRRTLNFRWSEWAFRAGQQVAPLLGVERAEPAGEASGLIAQADCPQREPYPPWRLVAQRQDEAVMQGVGYDPAIGGGQLFGPMLGVAAEDFVSPLP